MSTYPEWATKQQQEGMEKFIEIASEYGSFNVEFRRCHADEENTAFYADITWQNRHLSDERKHTFHVAWDYEQTWDHLHNRLYEWQFVFASGDVAREMSTETFFIDLFFKLDNEMLE